MAQPVTSQNLSPYPYPTTEKVPVPDVFHGTTITDTFRWLEENSPQTSNWRAAQHAFTLSQIAKAPQSAWIKQRLNSLNRFDYASTPTRCHQGERLFYHDKTKAQDRLVYYTKKNQEAPAEVLVDLNSWPKEMTLDNFLASDDGRYIAYGVALGGNENPVVRIFDVESKCNLPDTLQGRKQQVTSWSPGNVGFYYTAYHEKEDYWHATYYHKLGTPASEDKKVYFSDSCRLSFHIYDGRLYINRLENASTRIEIYDCSATHLQTLKLPGIGNAHLTGKVYLNFASPVHPREQYKYDVDSNTLTSVYRPPVEVDSTSFETKQVWYPAKDGTKISMFVVARKNLVLDGSSPTYLTGYGGFNYCMTLDFAGHMGATTLTQSIEDVTHQLSFLMSELNMRVPE